MFSRRSCKSQDEYRHVLLAARLASLDGRLPQIDGKVPLPAAVHLIAQLAATINAESLPAAWFDLRDKLLWCTSTAWENWWTVAAHALQLLSRMASSFGTAVRDGNVEPLSATDLAVCDAAAKLAGSCATELSVLVYVDPDALRGSGCAVGLLDALAQYCQVDGKAFQRLLSTGQEQSQRKWVSVAQRACEAAEGAVDCLLDEWQAASQLPGVLRLEFNAGQAVCRVPLAMLGEPG